MASAKLKKLNELVADGRGIGSTGDYSTWAQRAAKFVDQVFSAVIAVEFARLYESINWMSALGAQVGMLEGLAAKLADDEEAVSNGPAAEPEIAVPVPHSNKVFIVHGHDSGTKETVARFLEHIELVPIILHEKPNEGRTVIEKFEVYADVSFAVVLLTPDDVGAAKEDQSKVRPRARQNVVLELGYFVGKLKRSRVCALYKPGIEIPSDLHGVLYIEFDDKGAWRAQLAQELMNARLRINLEKLLKS